MEYGQFCPVAKAAGILGERWTLLIVRELLLGTTRFGELQRALATASPSILAKRLKELERAGIVAHVDRTGQPHRVYELTRAGCALGTVIDEMGTWAARWVPGTLAKDELDEYYLVLDISRRIDAGALPARTVNLGFRFRGGTGAPDWWLVLRDGKADICDRDPGYELDLLLSGSLRAVTEVWLGRTSLSRALARRSIRLAGDRALERSLQQWFSLSAYARARSEARDSGEQSPQPLQGGKEDERRKTRPAGLGSGIGR
ncbi:MAG: helix-turn-helix domain-containing protein [Gammaproteobacteria bacterium]